MSEELVRIAQSGDTSAFGELVRRYQRAAVLTAYGVLSDFHASQDAAQEAFVIAYRKLESLRSVADFHRCVGSRYFEARGRPTPLQRWLLNLLRKGR